MTKRSLTPGKIRGLQATSTDGVFCILAFDHRDSLRGMLKPEKPETVSDEDIVQFKEVVVRPLATHVSAVLLDPIYGAVQGISSGAIPGNIGLLVALEQTGYVGASTARVTALLPNWSVSAIKKIGASAVKLLIYYHPDAGEITEKQEALVRNVIEDCRSHDIPLFLEAVSYSRDAAHPKNSPEFAALRPKILRDTAEKLSQLGPDVLKLEFPVDISFATKEADWRKACRAVSDASQVPWTLLSASVDYDTYRRQVIVACQEGASGFMAGRAIWKEAIDKTGNEREEFLNFEASRRLKELKTIALREGRPWPDFFEAEPLPEDWYRRFGSKAL